MTCFSHSLQTRLMHADREMKPTAWPNATWPNSHREKTFCSRASEPVVQDMSNQASKPGREVRLTPRKTSREPVPQNPTNRPTFLQSATAFLPTWTSIGRAGGRSTDSSQNFSSSLPASSKSSTPPPPRLTPHQTYQLEILPTSTLPRGQGL